MAWARSDDVVYEDSDGQAVLINASGTELITLNLVGSLVWHELDGERSAEQIAAALAPRFDGVGLDRLTSDIEAFLGELDAAGLIERIRT